MRKFLSKRLYVFFGIILILLLCNWLYHRFVSKASFSEEEILGEDANHDGVRDDMEKYINSLSNISENLRKAMKQDARALQLALKAGDGPDSVAAAKEISRGNACLFRMSPADTHDAVRWSRLIENKMINTPARSRRYIKFNASLSGMLLGAPQRSSCDFEKQKSYRERDKDDEDEE